MDYRAKGVWLVLSGIAIGSIIGSGVAKRWGSDIGGLISSPNFATLLAGLGGASLGAVISFVIARQGSKLTLERDTQARVAEERSRALAVLLVTMQLSNRLYTLSLKLKGAVSDNQGEAWQKLQGAPDETIRPLNYDAKDLAPFIHAERGALIHRVFLLADRTRSLESSWNVYGRLRLKFEEFMLPFSRHVQGALVTNIPREHETHARYQMDQLNSLVDQMREYCERDLVDAKEIVEKLNAAFKERFGEEGAFQLKIGDDPRSSQTP